MWPGMESGPESSNELCGTTVRGHPGSSHGSGSHLHTGFGWSHSVLTALEVEPTASSMPGKGSIRRTFYFEIGSY